MKELAMELKKIDFEETGQFSKLFLDYIQGADQVKEFYVNQPTVEGFKQQIESKEFSKEARAVLHDTLQSQYDGLEIAEVAKNNISLLREENTYTVTTGHQLNIFTGPLYFIYKIVTVINICKQLKSEYPDCNFVPVYWMASEDHDFEEISYFRLNGNKHTWKTDQKGAVGRFDPKGLKSIIESVPGITEVFRMAYLKNKTLAGAVRYYVNELFGQYGLITIDADDRELKSQFNTVMEDDVFSHSPSHLVTTLSNQLNDKGYKTQVNPRDINFFYLEDGLRERIVEEDGKYTIMNTERSFSKSQIEEIIKNEPEKLSPNVILRPLYQETILPNLAYIGGPSEVAYWFQLKSIFDHFKVPFPILMPRNFALVIPAKLTKKFHKSGLKLQQLFEEKHGLFNSMVTEEVGDKVRLNGQVDEIMSCFEKIKAQAESIDPSLGPHISAQGAKTKNMLEQIEKKFIKAEKRNQSDRLSQIENLLDELFPNNNLQERTDNFLNFYLEDDNFINQLVEAFDPFDYRFNILMNG